MFGQRFNDVSCSTIVANKTRTRNVHALHDARISRRHARYRVVPISLLVFALIALNAGTAAAANHPPSALPDSMHANPGGRSTALIDGTVSLLANDTDADGDALQVAGHTDPSHGTLLVGSDGSFIYTNDNSTARSDGFTYTACDPLNLCSTANVSIDISTAQTPVATGDSILVKPAGSTSVLANGERSLLDNDIYPVTDAVFTALVTQPASGVVTLNFDGTFVYRNTDPTTTSDAFLYRLCDSGLCSIAGVTVNLSDNEPPIALSDSITMDQLGTATRLDGGALSVLANDFDPDGTAPLILQRGNGPYYGTLTLNTDGTFEYRNTDNTSLADGFEYRACDATACSTAHVDISFTGSQGEPRFPLAVDDAIQVPSGQTTHTLIGGATSVLANDSNPGDDGRALFVYPVGSGTNHGALTLTANGTFTYTNSGDGATADQFLYEVCAALCAVGTVNIAITNQPPDQLPVVTGDSIEVNAGDTASTLADGSTSVLANDHDPDANDTLTASLVPNGDPLAGTLTLNPDGTFTYTNIDPTATSDSFEYQACDALGACAPGTVDITIGVLAPDLSVESTHSGNFTQGQSGAQYTVNVANVGDASISGTVTIVDQLPAAFTATAVAGAGWDCTLATLTCTRNDVLPKGQSYPSIKITLDVAIGAPASATNTVTVANASDANVANNRSDDITAIGAPVVDFAIAKSHLGNFTQGQTGVQYAIKVRNAGGVASVGQVTVTEVAPNGLTLTALDGGATWACTVSPPRCIRSDSLPPGQFFPDITATFDVQNAAPATVTNIATVANGFDSNSGNDTARDDTTIIQVTAAADLGIVKSHVGDFHPGQTNAPYQLVVTNNGGTASSGLVAVHDALPAGLTARASSGGPGWNCSTTPTSLDCTRVDSIIPNDAFPPITLKVDVAQTATDLVNTATVANNGLVHSFDDPTLISPAGVDFDIASHHAGNFTRGQIGAQYVISVANRGDAASAGPVVVRDTLPSGVSATDIAGAGWSCDLATLTCQRFDALRSHDSYDAIVLTANVSPSAVNGSNVVSVAYAGDVEPSNDIFNDPTVIDAAASDLRITKTHVGNFSLGQVGAQFQLVVDSVGGAISNGLVTVHEMPPAGMTITAMNGTGWACPQPAGPCTRSDALASGQAYPPIDVMTTIGSDPSLQQLDNVADVANANDTQGSNNITHDTATISSTPHNLGIVKSHVGNFQKGQINAEYTLTVSNTGSVASNDLVSVADALPPKLTATSIEGDGWTCTQPVGPCTRSDALASGASYPTITLSVDVAADATNLVNNASLSDANDSDTSNNTASDATTIDPAIADLAMTVSHAGDFVAGQIGATYQLVVANAGGLAPTGSISVNDVLPPKLTARSISGTGWSCTQPAGPCTRGALPLGQAYAPITLTVDVADDASNLVNIATLANTSDQNPLNNVAADPTVIDSAQTSPSVLAADDAFTVHAGTSFDTTTSGTDQLANGQRSLLWNDRPQGLTKAVKVDDPTHGSVQLADDGTLAYTNSDSATTDGSDTFTYRACLVSSSSTCSAPATVHIVVIPQGTTTPPAGNPPVAIDDAAGVMTGGSIDTTVAPPTGMLIGGARSVLANDLGNATHAVLVAPPAHLATATDFLLQDDGTFRYRNNGDGATVDHFVYEACTDEHLCAVAVVTLSIGAVSTDAAPSAVDDAFHVEPGVTLDTTPAGSDTLIGGATSVLGNDEDSDAQAGELTAVLLVAPSHAGPGFALHSDGTITYESDDAGSDSFIYEACDALGACAAAVVTADVSGGVPDHLPVARDDQVEVALGGTSSVLVDGATSLLANDDDEDSGERATLTAHPIAGAGPAHGQVTIQTDGASAGAFTYTNDGSGDFDSFDYEACDVRGGCARATVWIAIGTGAGPTVTCVLPPQIVVAGTPDAQIDIDLTSLFSAPVGQTLDYGFEGLPSPPIEIDPFDHLVGMFLPSDAGMYAATLTATNHAPPLLEARENVQFVVLDPNDLLLRNGFEGPAAPRPTGCP